MAEECAGKVTTQHRQTVYIPGRGQTPCIALMMLIACGRLKEERTYAGLGPWYEARSWLAANPNPSPLASNRFESPAAALAFVDSLYDLGADSVYVLNVQQDSAWIAREGGPYADAILVALPRREEIRRPLFERGAREALREGFSAEVDEGQRYLYLWWD